MFEKEIVRSGPDLARIGPNRFKSARFSHFQMVQFLWKSEQSMEKWLEKSLGTQTPTVDGIIYASVFNMKPKHGLRPQNDLFTKRVENRSLELTTGASGSKLHCASFLSWLCLAKSVDFGRYHCSTVFYRSKLTSNHLLSLQFGTRCVLWTQ